MKKTVYHGGRFGKDRAWFSDNPKVAGGFGKITWDNYGIPQYDDYKSYEIEYNNPFIMDAKGENWLDIKTPKKLKPYWSGETIDSNGIVDICKKLGYDCIIIKNIEEGTTGAIGTDYCLLNGKYKNINESLTNLISLALDESLNERLEKMGDCFCTTSAYDIVNLLKNKPKEYRILYDAKIGYYLIGEAEHFIHHQLMEKAFDEGLYYPVKDFMQNMCGGFDKYSLYSYQDFGIDGYYDGENDENFDPFLYYIVFSPNEEWTLGTDGYNKRYDYPFGHVFTRGCDLSEIDLWDALGIPENSEKLNENLEKLQDGINIFGEDETVYATKSDYDIINLLKNKPEFYRFIWDSKSGYYIISNGDTCIHADLSNIGYNQGILDSRFIKDGICSLTFWKYDNEDSSRISDGCNFKYRYPFGYIYTRFDMSLEETSLYKTLGEPLEKIELNSSDMNESADNLNDAFWEWFAGSKVVDKNGNPLVVYHGTKADNIEVFKPSKIDKFEGIYFTDSFEVASTYAWAKPMACYLNIKNPLIVDAKGESYWGKARGTIVDALSNAIGKYDGVIIKNIDDDAIQDGEGEIATTYIVFSPNQIKSIDNKGTWSTSNNIYEALNRELERYL